LLLIPFFSSSSKINIFDAIQHQIKLFFPRFHNI